MTQVSLSTSTNFDGDTNAVSKDQITELTINLNLEELHPIVGLHILIGTDIKPITNHLDVFVIPSTDLDVAILQGVGVDRLVEDNLVAP